MVGLKEKVIGFGKLAWHNNAFHIVPCALRSTCQTRVFNVICVLHTFRNVINTWQQYWLHVRSSCTQFFFLIRWQVYSGGPIVSFHSHYRCIAHNHLIFISFMAYLLNTVSGNKHTALFGWLFADTLNLLTHFIVSISSHVYICHIYK
jgi:hypothetical protein